MLNSDKIIAYTILWALVCCKMLNPVSLPLGRTSIVDRAAAADIACITKKKHVKVTYRRKVSLQNGVKRTFFDAMLKIVLPHRGSLLV